jgi:4-amino-4-deoxy-L-arabinose transferase-like glycosyltransferase
VASTRHRQDVAAAVVLAILAFGLYSYRADGQPQTANEKPLSAAIDLLTARGGHDDAGRLLPVFVRVSPELWLPPVPVYTTLAIAAVQRAEQPGRKSAAVFGAIGVVLTYVFASGLFRQRAFGWIAALLLLSNPAYVAAARTGALDGVWVIPPLLLFLLAVRNFAETGSHRSLAVASAALAVCAYAQPSGAFLAVIVGATAVTGLGRARQLTVRDTCWAASGAAAVALPIALWFVVHPASYVDTLGRWFLHPAYIRNPWSLVLRLMNWFSLAEWASIYWNFFDPTRLLYSAAGPASAGTFLMAFGVLLGMAAYDLARPHRPRTAQESALLWIVAVGFVASPLVPASFAEPAAIQKALSLPLFGTILCTLGVRACWTRQSMWSRVAVVLVLGLGLAQFVAFYRSLVILQAAR